MLRLAGAVRLRRGGPLGATIRSVCGTAPQRRTCGCSLAWGPWRGP